MNYASCHGSLNIIVGPSLPFYPCCLAANLFRRQDVLVVTVAYNHRLLWLCAELLCAEQEYPRVRLAYSHYCRLHDVAEQPVKAELAEHGVYVAVEVTDQNEWEVSVKDLQHADRLCRRLAGNGVYSSSTRA